MSAIGEVSAFGHDASRRVDRLSYGRIAFLLAHFPMGIALQSSTTLATAHGAVTVGVAFWAILRWPVNRLPVVAAYIVASDVLWRMTGAQLPWELGKYASALVCLGGLLRVRHRAPGQLAPLLYLAALVPSSLVLFADPGLSSEEISQMIRFNLSGPVSLGVSVLCLTQLKLSRNDLLDVLLALLAPLLAIASITLLTTYTASDLSFSGESNSATSGGFGPNQVSVVLGLGALAALVWLVHRRTHHLPGWLLFSLLLLFCSQSAMTFSRGGLYSFVAATAAASWYLVRTARARTRLVTVLVLGTITATVAILPRLETLTEGALSARFVDTEPSHRDAIAEEDLRLWRENPLLGLGPGGARSQRQTASSMAHTEYTRLLSEHGIFGVLALLLLLVMAVRPFTKRRPAFEQALRAAFIAWGLFSMAHAGMRVAAFGFMFALGQVRGFSDSTDSPDRST